MNRKPIGLTLVETMVAAGLFMLLTAILFQVYRLGARAMTQSDVKIRLLQSVQVVSRRLAHEAEGSTPSSLSVHNGPGVTGLAFLSAVEPSSAPDPRFMFDPVAQRPVWQRYLIFYHDPGSQTVFVREEPLAPGSPEAGAPGPIDAYNGPGGVRPLPDYFDGGRPLGREISVFIVSSLPGTVAVDLEAQARRVLSEAPTVVQLRTVTRMRN